MLMSRGSSRWCCHSISVDECRYEEGAAMSRKGWEMIRGRWLLSKLLLQLDV